MVFRQILTEGREKPGISVTPGGKAWLGPSYTLIHTYTMRILDYMNVSGWVTMLKSVYFFKLEHLDAPFNLKYKVNRFGLK